MKKFLARFKIPETGCSRMLNYEVSTIVKKCQSSHSQNCAHQQLWFFSNAFTALYFQKEEEDPTCLLLEDFLIDATHVLHNILPGGLIYSFVSKQSTAISITLSHIAWQGTSASFYSYGAHIECGQRNVLRYMRMMTSFNNCILPLVLTWLEDLICNIDHAILQGSYHQWMPTHRWSAKFCCFFRLLGDEYHMHITPPPWEMERRNL